MAINKKYSFGDFMGQDLTNEPVEDFNGEIIGSCFAQTSPDTSVFPIGITTTFKRCNLDNVSVPITALLESDNGIDCTNKRIVAQNDGHYWEVNENSTPIIPIDEKYFIRLGASIDPRDIPLERQQTSITDNILIVAQNDRDARIQAIKDEAIGGI